MKSIVEYPGESREECPPERNGQWWLKFLKRQVNRTAEIHTTNFGNRITSQK